MLETAKKAVSTKDIIVTAILVLFVSELWLVGLGEGDAEALGDTEAPEGTEEGELEGEGEIEGVGLEVGTLAEEVGEGVLTWGERLGDEVGDEEEDGEGEGVTDGVKLAEGEEVGEGGTAEGEGEEEGPWNTTVPTAEYSVQAVFPILRAT